MMCKEDMSILVDQRKKVWRKKTEKCLSMIKAEMAENAKEGFEGSYGCLISLAPHMVTYTNHGANPEGHYGGNLEAFNYALDQLRDEGFILRDRYNECGTRFIEVCLK